MEDKPITTNLDYTMYDRWQSEKKFHEHMQATRETMEKWWELVLRHEKKTGKLQFRTPWGVFSYERI